MSILQLWVNNEDSTGAWTTVGSPPYLGAQDQPTNYIHDSDRNQDSGVYSFESTTEIGAITSVTLYIYAYGVSNSDFTTYLGATDTGLGPPASWGWVSVDVSSILTTWTEINAATIYFDRPNTTNEAGVDAAYLEIDYAGTTPQNGSITSDAVVKKAISQSVTADSVVHRSISQSISADAIVEKLISQAIGADAFVKVTVSQSVNADSIIQRSVDQSVIADSIVARSWEGDVTADAIVQKYTSDSVSASATILATVSDLVVADSIILSQAQQSVTADAYIQSAGPVADSITADAIVKTSVTDSVSFDAIVERTADQSIYADAIIEKLIGQSIFADAAINISVSGSFTADAVIKKTRLHVVWYDPDGEGLCIWAAYQPKGAANLAASYVDLSGNGNNAGVGVAPTWDAVNGWKFNGVDQYLTTTFVPAADQTQTMIVQYTNAVTAFRFLCGLDDGANKRFQLSPVYGLNIHYSNGGRANVAGALAAGNVCVAGSDGYRNGVSEGLALAAWAGATARTVYIGAYNVGAPSNYTDAYIQAFALYDCTLTAPQVLAVATAMESFAGNPVTADAIIKKSNSQSVTVDAYITSAAPVQDSITADAIISPSCFGPSSDTWQNTVSEAYAITANAIIKKGNSQSVAADSIIERVVSQSITVDAIIEKPVLQSITINATIKTSVTQSVTADAWIESAKSGSVTADAIVEKSISQSVTADAFISVVGVETISADAIIKKGQSQSVTANAWVEVYVAGLVTADAVIKKSISESITANAIIVSSNSGSITADATIVAAISQSVSVDAIVKSAESGSVIVDAIVEKSVSQQITAGAIVSKVASGLVAAGAIIEKSVSGYVVVDSVVKKSVQESVYADAKIIISGSNNFPADAWVVIERSGSFVLDAVVIPVPCADVTVNIIVDTVLYNTKDDGVESDQSFYNITCNILANSVECDCVTDSIIFNESC